MYFSMYIIYCFRDGFQEKYFMFGGFVFNIYINLYYDIFQIKIFEKIVKYKIYEVISFKILICNYFFLDKCISLDYVEDNLIIIFRKKGKKEERKRRRNKEKEKEGGREKEREKEEKGDREMERVFKLEVRGGGE